MDNSSVGAPMHLREISGTDALGPARRSRRDSLLSERSGRLFQTVTTTVGERVEGCFRPLPRNLKCCGLGLPHLFNIFVACQALYGLLLIFLHTLLLSPPFNEPKCDWLPGSGPWLELLDLQWSLRIRGNRAYDWEAPMLRYSTHGNFAGTVLGLLIGVLTFLFAIFAEFVFRRPFHGNSAIRTWETAWLGFSTVEVIGFFLCNLGKISTLCNEASSPGMPDSTVAAHREAPLTSAKQYPGEHIHQAARSSVLFPALASHCDILEMWFIEWTFMAGFLGFLGLWACWSYVNARRLEAALADQTLQDESALRPLRRFPDGFGEE